jgi:ABC-2 type transport system ATP-binding protein
MKLVIEDLSKRYSNGVQALDKVSLTIPHGMFGLLGPNGAGKSTLMRTLATLQEADSGAVKLGQIDLLREPRQIRKVLGYLPQDFGVYPKVSAYDLLDYLACLKGLVDSKNRRAVIEELLQRTNLYSVRRQKLGTFSGGMRQRFGIAQALLGDPKLVIVDEPTAGLDPEERVRFHNLLADIADNVIVILSTHIVDDVSDLCANFAVINKGRVLMTGDPRSLVDSFAGRIWSKTVSKSEVEELRSRLPIISGRLHGGKTFVRAYADEAPEPGFEPAEPELEDVYFSAITGRLTPLEAVET